MSLLPPQEGRLRTRCSACSAEFYIGASLAMQMGLNTGHCTCAKCKTFLHVEILEGDVAWTERHSDWLKRATGESVKQDVILGNLITRREASEPHAESDGAA